MSQSLRTKIEWADYSLNFWWGCTKVSPACAHCYAEAIARVFAKGRATWGPSGARWLQWDGASQKLAKIVRAAKRTGVRPRVFVNSMSDTFEENPRLDVVRCLMLVRLAEVTEVDFLLLTKRPENIRAMVPPGWLREWPAHIWIGATVENQPMAEARLLHLCSLPAAVIFVSCEPLLGALDLSAYLDPFAGEPPFGAPPKLSFIDWVICGGESGAGARPMHPEWARGLREQCAEVGVPFFFKQWGEWLPSCQYRAGDKERLVEKAQHSFDADTHAWWVGKKSAGRLLDGIEHSALPEVR